ncbi:MAG: hypothetical protein Q9209_006371 [Squamulea sp. 1 TL-2023]
MNRLSLRVGYPPEPWNKHVCRDDQLYNVYLTFSWGIEVPGAALGAVIHYTRHKLQEALHIHGDFQTKAVVQQRSSLTIKARGFEDHGFYISQMLAAVDLFQLCGFDKGHRNEMWAYMYNAQNQRIADIALQFGIDQAANSRKLPSS